MPIEFGNLFDYVCFFICRDVYLNGEKLQMVDIHTMPTLNPVKIDLASDELVLPEMSFGFLVLPDVQAAACISS